MTDDSSLQEHRLTRFRELMTRLEAEDDFAPWSRFRRVLLEELDVPHGLPDRPDTESEGEMRDAVRLFLVLHSASDHDSFRQAVLAEVDRVQSGMDEVARDSEHWE